jgi:GR25 family glycosyltransferase involved in LPS biosynthesis
MQLRKLPPALIREDDMTTDDDLMDEIEDMAKNVDLSVPWVIAPDGTTHPAPKQPSTFDKLVEACKKLIRLPRDINNYDLEKYILNVAVALAAYEAEKAGQHE